MESMPKQKVTVTVEKKLLDWTDKQIESFRFRNRSHAFEYALAKLMENEKKTAERHYQLL
jgi:Arc/MetJ-type ribon-helix-helix transcriptional regulator